MEPERNTPRAITSSEGVEYVRSDQKPQRQQSAKSELLDIISDWHSQDCGEEDAMTHQRVRKKIGELIAQAQLRNHASH